MSTTIDSSLIGRVNGGPSAGQKGRESDELRDNFMTLLITQLKNQDPLNPMENSEMTSQLAQINTVNGIEDLNRTLGGIASQIDAGQALQATGLIGQGVLVPGDRVLLDANEEGQPHTTPFGIELAQSADNVEVTILGGDGQEINRYDIGPVDAGVASFTWNGLTSQGERAVPGSYRVRIDATRGDEGVAAEALNYAVVGGITPQDGQREVRLDLGAVYGQVGLNQIKQIL